MTKLTCNDKLSGEEFHVDSDADIESQIRDYIADGIDSDSGDVDYDVDVDDGQNFRGTVRA